MFTQIYKFIAVAAGALALAACGSNENQRDPNAEVVECALDGAADYAKDCTIERNGSEEGLVLTIGREDKGYRRFVVTKDGTGVRAADGAEAATIAIVDNGMVDVTVGKDRYRLPATIKQP